MTGPGPFTTYTANLTDLSMEALTAAAEQTGANRTDTINTAVQVYARIIQVHDEGHGWADLVLQDAPGRPCRVQVNPRPWWRFL